MPFKDKNKQRACAKESYRRHGDKWKAKAKLTRFKRYLWASYRLTEERYWQIYKDQDGKCAICGRTGVRLFVDHLHETNHKPCRRGEKVRGLLCSKCNLLLGHAFESIDILKASIGYLEKYNEFTVQPKPARSV